MIDSQPPTVPTYHLFAQPADKAVQEERSRPWAGTEFSFHDLLDTINPLQHIPVVSTVYRWLTGDTIGNIPRIAGDTLYGGPLGFIAGVVGATLKQESGADVGDHVLAMVTGGDSADPGRQAAPTQAVADAGSATPAAAAAPTTTAAAVDGSASPVTADAAAAAGLAKSAAVAPGTAGLSLAAGPAPADGDPRAAFLARGDGVRRVAGAQPSRPLTNRPVPLEGIGLPPGFAVPRPQQAALKPAAPATSVAALPPAAGPAAPVAANLPSNPPIDISQQMLDALDKYARMKQQRGSQLDVVQ